MDILNYYFKIINFHPNIYRFLDHLSLDQVSYLKHENEYAHRQRFHYFYRTQFN